MAGQCEAFCRAGELQVWVTRQGRLILVCDECDAAWFDPENISESSFTILDPQTSELDEGDPVDHLADLAEVEAGGWTRYVDAWARRQRELMSRWKAHLRAEAGRTTWIGHEHIREALQEFADEELQRRRWTATGSEVSSLTEAISMLYDDSALVLELEAGREVYRPDIDQMLSDLLVLLKKIDQRRPAEEIL